MRDVTRVVNRVPILRDGELVGAIGRVAFRTPEEVHELSRQISSLRAEVDYYKQELAGLRHRAFGLDEIVGESDQIGRAHVCTPVTNAHLVCRLLLEKKKHENNTLEKSSTQIHI